MNIDITFPHAPCWSKNPLIIQNHKYPEFLLISPFLIVIEIDSRSTVGTMNSENINRNLFKRRLTVDGKAEDQVEPDYNNAR